MSLLCLGDVSGYTSFIICSSYIVVEFITFSPWTSLDYCDGESLACVPVTLKTLLASTLVPGRVNNDRLVQ